MFTPINKIPHHTPSYWLIFSEGKLVLSNQQKGLHPSTWQELTFAHEYDEQIVKLGQYRDTPCFMIDMGSQIIDSAAHDIHSLRSLYMQTDSDGFQLLAKAWQYALFLRTHKFCGQCGKQTDLVDWEMAVHCHTCHHRSYPRISPCIIVAIRKGRQLLLAQGKAQKEMKLFSTLAGFVESGESLEQAVHREVMEEVGINVTNLRYVSSQPWPFPHSLMMGYFADYESGEIQVDGREILEANWYDIDKLPNVPPTLSIAGQLIAASIEEITSAESR